MKKPPKGDPRDPKRLKKDLPKFMKTLAPGDRIMFVGKFFITTSGFTSGSLNFFYSGCSDHPWDGEVKAMEAVFDRFIRVPKMIYGTRRLLFRHFIEQHGAEIEETELSALTIIADKYSVNDIKTVCRRVLTSHRVKRNKVSHL